MKDEKSDLELRPAVLADAAMVADLEALRDVDDPRDPEMLRFWWTANLGGEKIARFLAEGNDAAIAFSAAGYQPWDERPERFGWTRTILHPDVWSEDRYRQLVATAESWLRDEGANIAVARVREDFKKEIDLLLALGYREARRAKSWELDLVGGRERLMAAAARSRERMADQGVRLLTLDRDDDPERMTKLWKMTNEAEQDIPTTMPIPELSYGDFHRLWFDNPGTHSQDRFWIARDGDAIVGISVIGYPPVRGLPWTAFTGTSRSARGRGIARALKYETVAQAIAIGVKRIRTSNDGSNAPILHLNAEMGYQPIPSVIEMHRELSA